MRERSKQQLLVGEALLPVSSPHCSTCQVGRAKW